MTIAWELMQIVIIGPYLEVDLNRNFPTGYKEERMGSETNSGPFPLSEDFSKCLESIVLYKKPDAFLDVHTGEFSIFYASDSAEELSVLN